jgi:hypothetical protein
MAAKGRKMQFKLARRHLGNGWWLQHLVALSVCVWQPDKHVLFLVPYDYPEPLAAIRSGGVRRTRLMSTSGGGRGAHRLAQFIEGLAEKGVDCKDLAARIRDPILFRPMGGQYPQAEQAR